MCVVVLCWIAPARLFTCELAASNDYVSKTDDIQKWFTDERIGSKDSKQECGMTKRSLPQHKETWWWNRDVEEVVAKR